MAAFYELKLEYISLKMINSQSIDMIIFSPASWDIFEVLFFDCKVHIKTDCMPIGLLVDKFSPGIFFHLAFLSLHKSEDILIIVVSMLGEEARRGGVIFVLTKIGSGVSYELIGQAWWFSADL